jgi:hypothetical protein
VGLITVVVLVVPVFGVHTIISVAIEVDVVENGTKKRSVNVCELLRGVHEGLFRWYPRPCNDYYAVRYRSEHCRVRDDIERR